MWNILGHKDTISYETWPTFDEAKLVENTIEIPVQMNGKLKATVVVPSDSSEDIVKNIIHSNETILELTNGKSIIKEIYVKNKIYNIVVK